MNKEELLLDIIEKVHDQCKETSRKVDELQIEQVRQGEMHRINTENLKEHMKRTESVEKRLAFYDSVSVTVAGIAAIILFLIKVIPVLSHFL